jgi:hypothetical protein
MSRTKIKKTPRTLRTVPTRGDALARCAQARGSVLHAPLRLVHPHPLDSFHPRALPSLERTPHTSTLPRGKARAILGHLHLHQVSWVSPSPYVLITSMTAHPSSVSRTSLALV